MYRIKQIPEDFVVKEVIDLKLDKNGKYFYYLLKKRNHNTLRAVEHIKAKVKYAGNKDKRAVTEQFVSTNKKIRNIKLKDLELNFIGRGNEPISLGSHQGNYFEITVRNLNNKNRRSFCGLKPTVFDPSIFGIENCLTKVRGIKPTIFNKNVKTQKKRNKIKNYFGEQRFSKDNVEIGRYIIKRNFKDAVKLIDVKLEVDNNDYVGALRRLPIKLLKLYIHAYQSYLFNETIKKIKGNKNIKIPLIGFETEIGDIKNKELRNIIKRIMEREKITPRDFIIREIPELSSEGSFRDLFMEIKELKIEKLEKDELNNGKYKIKLKFILDKGCYATVVVKELFKLI